MAVKVRLARRGRKRLAIFDITIADSRAPRDGRFIEKIGVYNPNTIPATIELSEEKAVAWLLKGAQPTDTVRRIFAYKGILMRKHLQVGVLKGAITQEEADKRYAAFIKDRETKIEAKRNRVASDLAKSKAEKLAAEIKVKEARAEAIRKKGEAPAQDAAPSEESAAE